MEHVEVSELQIRVFVESVNILDFHVHVGRLRRPASGVTDVHRQPHKSEDLPFLRDFIKVVHDYLVKDTSEPMKLELEKARLP
jgi:hypothetical protein